MDINYRLKRDCVSRTATMLAWNLKEISNGNGIRITYNNMVFNGTSLIGILNAHMMCGEQFILTIDDLEIINDVKRIIEEIAEQV